MLPIKKVSLGARPGYHVLSLKFSRELRIDEERRLCALLVHHLVEYEVFLLREFGGRNEVHFWPSPKSAALFTSLPEAIEEYHLFLQSLGCGNHEIIVDGNLLPFDERESSETITAAGLRYGE